MTCRLIAVACAAPIFACGMPPDERAAPGDPPDLPEVVLADAAVAPPLAADAEVVVVKDAGDASAPRACAIDAAWGSIEHVPEVGGPGQSETARLTEDGLEIFFTRRNDQARHIFTARRASTASPFGPPNELFSGMGPTITPDGLDLYFKSSSPGGVFTGRTFQWVHRPSRSEAFGPVAELTVPMPSPRPGYFQSVDHLYVEANGAAILLHGLLGQGDTWTIRRASLGAAGVGASELVSGAPANWMTGGPVLSKDGRALFTNALNPLGAFMQLRDNPQSPFGPTQRVAGLPPDAVVTWISGDACTIYFDSASTDGSRIYRARRL